MLIEQKSGRGRTVLIYLFQIIMIGRILKFYREVTILKNTLTVLLLERKWICMKREIKYNSYSKTPAKNVVPKDEDATYWRVIVSRQPSLRTVKTIVSKSGEKVSNQKNNYLNNCFKFKKDAEERVKEIQAVLCIELE